MAVRIIHEITECPKCKGEGTVPYHYQDGDGDWWEDEEQCSECDGTGNLIDDGVEVEEITFESATFC